MKLLVLAVLVSEAWAQSVSHRGFLESLLILYPQEGANDSALAVGESLLRYEASAGMGSGLRFFGAFDARIDTHHQVDRSGKINFFDRGLQRPALSIRRASVLYNRGKFTIEGGKQFIRWGKADILNPTDRFAPRDFLAVVNNDFLGVTALRATYEASATTVDAVWQPVFTPSRAPLLNQRWVVLPAEAQHLRIVDTGAAVPGGSQFGIRANHIGRGFEASASFYEGHNHLPLLEGSFDPGTFSASIRRVYPSLRMYGADAAVPLPWFAVKGEAAWFTTSSRAADEYVLYVLQLERLSGEWNFAGGYAGEWVTERRSPFDFAPDRGLTRAFLGRAGYTIDSNRSIALEGAVRQNLNGVWIRAEYSQAFGQHWRVTAGFTAIRGEPDDFLGQYRRNSHATLGLRYSF